MYEFSKYEGLGNDFLVFDCRLGVDDKVIARPKFAKSICNRRFGVGADGLVLLINPKHGGDLGMRIINSDGTEAEMCGNGIRCLVKYLLDKKEISKGNEISVETLAGKKTAIIEEDSQITVDMGPPDLIPSNIPTQLEIGACGLPQGEINLYGHKLDVSAVGMGNPHAIIPVEDLTEIPFEKLGSTIEKYSLFPSKTNVHFLQLINRRKIKILVWERGSGATLACGTGACASLVAAYLLGLSEKSATINLPGGDLKVTWPGPNESVYMKGPANSIFKGQIYSENLEIKYINNESIL